MKKAMNIILWFVVVGFSPFWYSLAIVIAGAIRSSAGSNYWATAPWLIIIGMYYCWISLLVAAVTYLVFIGVTGSLKRRLILASLTFCTSAVLGAGWAWRPYQKRQIVQDRYDRENAEGIKFVAQHPLVKAQLGASVELFLGISSVPEDVNAERELVYSAHAPDRTLDRQLIIVRVLGPSDRRTFKLRCLSTQFAYSNREYNSDPCHPVFSDSHPPPTDHEVILAE